MIYNEINSGAFSHWLAQSDTYKDNFTYKGANALQEYMEDMSNDLGENIEFDPIAWCCEFSEYANIDDYNKQHGTDYALGLDDTDRPDITDETTVIDFDGGIIVQDF